MEVVFARIDERLMHGIVLTQYLPSSNAQRIMVIDDKVANNQIKKDAMLMAKPAGYAASIIPLEKALTNIQAGKYEGQRLFLLTKSPITMEKLCEVGVKIPELIIGCTEMLNQGIKLSERAFITEEELEACKKMSNNGTKIYVQFSITTPKVDIWKAIQNNN